MDYIRVNENYRGKLTKEELIKPGMYAADDPALFGLAKYLVELGVAEKVYGVQRSIPAPKPDEDEGFEPPAPGGLATEAQLAAIMAAEQNRITPPRAATSRPTPPPAQPARKPAPKPSKKKG